MTVILNDKKYEAPEGISLASFIESIGLKPQGIAIAIGDVVVSKELWTNTILSDKLEIMLIHAVSGG
jgi:thiamine biosynthesis protein ThiS